MMAHDKVPDFVKQATQTMWTCVINMCDTSNKGTFQ